MINVTLDDITLSKDAPTEDILALLKKYGVAKLSGWLDEDIVAALRCEQEAVYESGGAGVSNMDYSRGRFARLKRRELIVEQFPTITKVFADPRMEEVARHYIGDEFLLNEEIFVSDDDPSDLEIVPIHYDKIWMFKFYFYLADTTREDGAFSLIPGSQLLGRSIREFYISRGMPLIEQPNKSVLPAGLPKPLTIEGMAGDLIIFDTDAYHLGANVAPGHRRRVMRGHTWKVPCDTYHPTYRNNMAQWIREWAFNPVTFARRLGDRLTARRAPDRWTD